MWHISLIIHLLILGQVNPSIPTPTNQLNVTILHVRKSRGVVAFSVRVTNRGRTPVALEESAKGKKDLYAAQVEQLDSVSSWIDVGPYHDVPPHDVFVLDPGKQMNTTVTIPNPYSDMRSATSPSRAIKGSHRIILRYFLDEEDWIAFLRTPGQKPKTVVSSLISVPERVDDP